MEEQLKKTATIKSNDLAVERLKTSSKVFAQTRWDIIPVLAGTSCSCSLPCIARFTNWPASSARKNCCGYFSGHFPSHGFERGGAGPGALGRTT